MVIGIALIIVATPFIFTPLYIEVANLVLPPVTTNVTTKYTFTQGASGKHSEIPSQDFKYFTNPSLVYPAHQNYTINIIMEDGDTVNVYVITQSQFDYWDCYKNPSPPSSYVDYYHNANSFNYTWTYKEYFECCWSGDNIIVVLWNGHSDSVYVDSIELCGTNLVLTETLTNQIRETNSRVIGWVLFSIGITIFIVSLVVSVNKKKLKSVQSAPQVKTQKPETKE